MTTSLLVILLLAGLGLIAWGMGGRDRIYQFPFLISAVLLGWIMPQLAGLARASFLPPEALDMTIFMTILTVGACWLGYNWPVRSMRFMAMPMNVRRLEIACAGLSLVGAFFFYKISTLPEEVVNASQWTGTIVAYDFFARALNYGFILGILVYLMRRSPVALAVCLFDGAFYFQRIVIAGRRAVMLEFAAAIGLAFWFQWRIVPPRVLVLAGLAVGALFINAIAQYRAATLDRDGPRWEDVLQIDLLGNFEQILDQGGDELANAAYIITATERRSAFDFGAFNWNALVFAYVPAQIVGAALKKSLYLDLGLGNPMFDEFMYKPRLGTTTTGMADAFGSFWYFGAVKFFLVAVIMRKLYLAAMQGNVVGQACYITLLTPSLHTLTHHTQWFFNAWVHMAIFLLPSLWLCRAGAAAPPESGPPLQGGPRWHGASF